MAFHTKTPVNMLSTLDITALRNYSDDMITCVTTLLLTKEDGPADKRIISTALLVAVHYAPESYSVKVVRGGNVSPECSAKGHPPTPPEIKWNYTAAVNTKEATRGRQKHGIVTWATSANSGVDVDLRCH
ncbi:hypothetical protein NHX12_031591 [Muraenolepis orangiensis]|uniref:Ig-like domain-containing protein n=1 Tax=Muraenolepis orangiensis TaxID=630683 RepID=A0A9Q0IKT1_9TELE|nr:hypothetical protein NHX12_031591 [Muraenolepis orangiensis]